MCKKCKFGILSHAKENTMHDPSSFEALNPQQMCHKAVVIMAGKALRPAPNAFMLAVMAGVFIGLGFVYCAVANTAGAGKIVGGLVFSLGLMLVIVLGADLFTSTTMTLLPRACRKITWGQMFSNWGIVYAGNDTERRPLGVRPLRRMYRTGPGAAV